MKNTTAFSLACQEKTGASNLPLHGSHPIIIRIKTICRYSGTLEFTASPEPPDHHPDEDDLPVFYIPAAAYPGLIENILQTGAPELPA